MYKGGLSFVYNTKKGGSSMQRLSDDLILITHNLLPISNLVAPISQATKKKISLPYPSNILCGQSYFTPLILEDPSSSP